MKIALTDNGLQPRFQPFLDTLRHKGHIIEQHTDKTIPPTADVWFVDFHQSGKPDIHAYMISEMNKYEASFLSYSGKLIFYTIDDGGISCLVGASPAIKQRLDAWVTFVRHPIGYFRPEDIAHKFVLIPRYSISYRPYVRHIKQNQFVFIGHITGGYNCENQTKNLRVECVRHIRNSWINK